MPAPIGNKFALGNSGLQKDFESPEELKMFIQEYFDDCDNRPLMKLEQKKGATHIKVDKGVDINEIKEQIKESLNSIVSIPVQRPYSIDGLCLHLGITRQTLLNYRKKRGYEEYFDVVTWAKRKITLNNVEMGLIGIYDPRLVQFLLINNDDYKNKIEETSKGEMKIKWVEELTHETESETNDGD